MKRIILQSIILMVTIAIPIDMIAGNFWKGVGRALSSIAEAATGAVIQQSCVKSGYSAEESAQMTRDFMEVLGANTQNVERGLSYVNASDKYEKQNIVKDVVFDFAGDVSGNTQFVETFRQMTDAQLTYLSAKKNATSDEERQNAFNERTRTYADIFYDTYQEAKEVHAKHLAEKKNISRKLIEQGYDSNLAMEVAGNIIAITNSEMDEAEKERLLKRYDFIASSTELQNTVEEIVNEKEDIEAKRKKEEMERQRLEEERKEAERRAAEEKNNAINRLTSIIPCGYKFDTIELSDTQKNELQEVINIMIKYEDLSILLTGHTCKIGYKSINQKKGLQRADIVKKYLVENGVAESRITTDSKGETQPIADNNTQVGRSQNRRVEISIVE